MNNFINTINLDELLFYIYMFKQWVNVGTQYKSHLFKTQPYFYFLQLENLYQCNFSKEKI